MLLREQAPDDEAALREAHELQEAATSFRDEVLSAADVKYMKQAAHDNRRSRMMVREKYRRG